MSRAWDEASRLRAAIMRDGLPIARLKGLEIGPLANPIVARSEGDITYVDQADTDSLRRTYAGDTTINPANIVEIDAVWGQQALAEGLGGCTVDYVMASHVAEHVPDLVTWLAEVRSVLKPGGELRLALPDRRFSHDALRTETRLSQLLTAWVLGARKPQVQDVLDFRLYTASGVDGGRVFRDNADLSSIAPDHPFEVAVRSAEAARDRPDLYFDVHCLVASAKWFAHLMAEIAARGLLPMRCARMIDTAPPLFEFYVFMTPCEDPAEIRRSWHEAWWNCDDPLPGSAAASQIAEAAQERARLAALAGEAERARAELAAVRLQLAALQRSASWRLTAPLRRLRSRM